MNYVNYALVVLLDVQNVPMMEKIVRLVGHHLKEIQLKNVVARPRNLLIRIRRNVQIAQNNVNNVKVWRNVLRARMDMILVMINVLGMALIPWSLS